MLEWAQWEAGQVPHRHHHKLDEARMLAQNSGFYGVSASKFSALPKARIR